MHKIESSEMTVEQSLARLASVERFFEQRGIGEDSIELVLGGRSTREGMLVVRFDGEDHDNFPL